MKNIYAIAGLIALSLAGMSCVQELNEGQNTIPSSGTQVSLSVYDEEWVPSKSAFTAGDGIRLTKNEKIALFYDNGSLLVGLPETNKTSYPIAATPQGGGSYSFKAPEGSLDKTWYGVVPYSYAMTRARINTSQQFMLIFPCVQFPGQNTFDPQTDVLVAKPFTIEGEGDNTATIAAFERITAPFKLQIIGLDPGEKIYAVTFAMNKNPSSTEWTTALTGSFFYDIGSEPGDFKSVGYYLPASRSNDFSAVYDEGLVAEGGVWPVWFNVLPNLFLENSKVTLTVFTANACYIKSNITIKRQAFSTKHINTFTVNLSGITPVPAISQGFFHNDELPLAKSIAHTATENTISHVASDGTTNLDWTMKAYNWTALEMDGGSMLPNALGFPDSQGAYIKIPSVEGKTITKVRLYLASLSYADSSTFPLVVYNGDASITTYSTIAMFYNTPSKGGCIDIPCPDGVSDMAGLTLKFGACSKRAHALVSRIVLFTN